MRNLAALLRHLPRPLALAAGLAAAAFGLGACAMTDVDSGTTADHPFEPNDAQLLDPSHIYRTMPPGE